MIRIDQFPQGFKGDLNALFAAAAPLIHIWMPSDGANLTVTFAKFADGFQGDLDETFQQAIHLMTLSGTTKVVNIAIAPFPEGFHGDADQTFQQAVQNMTAYYAS